MRTKKSSGRTLSDYVNRDTGTLLDHDRYQPSMFSFTKTRWFEKFRKIYSIILIVFLALSALIYLLSSAMLNKAYSGWEDVRANGSAGDQLCYAIENDMLSPLGFEPCKPQSALIRELDDTRDCLKTQTDGFTVMYYIGELAGWDSFTMKATFARFADAEEGRGIITANLGGFTLELTRFYFCRYYMVSLTTDGRTYIAVLGEDFEPQSAGRFSYHYEDGLATILEHITLDDIKALANELNTYTEKTLGKLDSGGNTP